MFPLEGLSNYPEFQLINLQTDMKPRWMRLPWLEMKFFKFLKVFPKSPTVTVFFKVFLAQPQDCSILKSVPFLIW